MNYLTRRVEAARGHQDEIWEQGLNELDVVGVDGKRLTLADGRELTEFMSCSYLGLDQRSELRDAAHDTIDRFGVQMSAARTRMRAAPLRELDELLTTINDGWSPVTFNAVSAAHLATIPVLASGELPGYPIASGGPAFVLDKSAHASLQGLRGIMDQFGKTVRADFQDLESVTAVGRDLAKSGRTVIAVSDSMGSMGGSVDVPALTTAIDNIGGITYLDDAHGTSIFGSKGEGFVLDSTNGDLPSRTIWTGSLSKAFGATGGFVSVANADAANFLKRYSVPYAFGGPPSLPAIGSAVASAHLHLDGTVRKLQGQLHENTELLDAQLTSPSINTGAESPIRGIMMGEESVAINAARTLQERGYAGTTAMYPTVKLGQAMIRLAISASHSGEDIRGIAGVLNEITDRQTRRIHG
ncbi:MAG TPA: aminotransferase class I/II-fold pyridoxal phosphate-dependent enzyme [Nevskiaceae bacterium]|nr:aminotransferase class I/II-fold pyridoxal phosphate-dependent enzyme [Nevskiaceae bacterium]